MKTETVEIGEKTYEVRELKFHDLVGDPDAKDQKLMTKKMVMMATRICEKDDDGETTTREISEEEYNDLSMGEGMKLFQVINELNGLTDINF